MPTEIEQLYREQRAGLVRLVERELRDHHDAEDVVQTAFLDAQRAIERGTVPRNPRAWLATIALNAARRLRRRRLNAEPLEEYAVQEAMGMSEIRAALANLPSEQRAAVLYRDVLGLSYSETADQMGTSVNAVTMLLHRGRQRLRQTLGVATAGLGLGRWLRRAGLPQAAAAKGAVAVVAAAGLATAGVVAAHEAAPTGAADLPPAQSGRPTAGGGRAPGGTVALGSARRHSKAAPTATSPAPTVPSTQAATQDASPARSPLLAPTTTAAASLLQPSTVSVPEVPVPTVPATVAVSPVATVTVSTPTTTTVAVTTPIVTVTVPLP